MGRPRSKKSYLLPLTLTAVAVLLIVGYSGNDEPTQLEQVLQRGKLTMLTRNGASTYYIGPEGATGPEVELVRQFAHFLGVGLEIRAAETFGGLAGML